MKIIFTVFWLVVIFIIGKGCSYVFAPHISADQKHQKNMTSTQFHKEHRNFIIIVIIGLLLGIHVCDHFFIAHYTSPYHLPPTLWNVSLGTNLNPSYVLHRSYISVGNGDNPGQYNINKVTQLSHDKLKVYTDHNGIFIITYDGGNIIDGREISIQRIDSVPNNDDIY